MKSNFHSWERKPPQIRSRENAFTWLKVIYREPTVSGMLDGERLDSPPHTNYKERNKNCPCLQMT